jgi:stalled ribosome rescue protein Dom34
MDTMEKDHEMVAFGTQDFKKALVYGAVETALVSEGFIEEMDQKRRAAFLKALEHSSKTGSKIYTYPKTSSNYKEICALSGLAFTLRFKII